MEKLEKRFDFGDCFLHPETGEPCIVTFYNNDKNWWYVSKTSPSRVFEAKFTPEECRSWVRFLKFPRLKRWNDDL